MGLAANATPAINAPISSERPRRLPNSAILKHQAIDSKKVYSLIRSNRVNNLSNTYFSNRNAKVTKAGKATTIMTTSFTENPPVPSAFNNSNTKIAIKSCINSTPMTNSPVC